jgi:Protein tyrosine and serine/threonine kinase
MLEIRWETNKENISMNSNTEKIGVRICCDLSSDLIEVSTSDKQVFKARFLPCLSNTVKYLLSELAGFPLNNSLVPSEPVTKAPSDFLWLTQSTAYIGEIDSNRLPHGHGLTLKSSSTRAIWPKKFKSSFHHGILLTETTIEQQDDDLPLKLKLSEFDSSLLDCATPVLFLSDPSHQVLGSGSYGRVFEVCKSSFKNSSHETTPYSSTAASAYHTPLVESPHFAGKLFRSAKHNNQDLLKEFAVLKLLGSDHPSIVKLLGIGQLAKLGEIPNYLLLMELCEFSVADILTNNPKSLTLLFSLSILTDTANGLTHIHSLGIGHFDLKSANILIQGNHAKICDFGNASIRATPQIYRKQSRPCSFAWASPESLRNEPISLSSDLFSLGILVWEIFTRQSPPWRGCAPSLVIAAVGYGGQRPEYHKGIKIPRDSLILEEVHEIFDDLSNFNPVERPSAAAVAVKFSKIYRKYRKQFDASFADVSMFFYDH